MIARPMPDIPLNGLTVKEIFHYDPETGIMRWNISGGKVRKGDTTGCPGPHGHLRTRYRGSYYRVARLAWLYMTGDWPSGEIDHKDNTPDNDRWENLRDCSHRENMGNVKVRCDSASGIKGVVFYKPRGKWLARINGRHIGYFATALEAKSAHDTEAAKIYGEFARS